MVARVEEEEIQALKLHHAEEVNTLIETSPIDLLSPERVRKAEKLKLSKAAAHEKSAPKEIPKKKEKDPKKPKVFPIPPATTTELS